MRVLRLALTGAMRLAVRSALKDKSLEGILWLKCEAKYSVRLILFCLLAVLVFLVAWALPPGYDGIAWLVAIGYAAALALTYLISLLAWSLFVSGLRFVVYQERLLEVKNWLVGVYPISRIRKITFHQGKSIVVTEGQIQLQKGSRQFRFRSPMKDKMTSFFKALVARTESTIASSNLQEANTAYRRAVLLTMALVLAFAVAFVALIPVASSVARDVIDLNNYRNAVSHATASALREYLRDDRNTNYRVAADKSLKGLYNQSIAKVGGLAGDKAAMTALHDILVYLRDHDQYVVLMDFHSSSRLQESNDAGVSIRPIASTFDSAGRSALEGEVSDSVNKGFGGILAADILTIGQPTTALDAPALRIDYSYSNSDYVYFPTSQKDLPIEKRTLYYGLRISWRIQAAIPMQKAVTIAKIESEPAATFDYVEGSTDAMIYKRMAETAFEDLAAKISKSLGLK